MVFDVIFQPTYPLRGTTCSTRSICGCLFLISTHVPRTRHDAAAPSRATPPIVFQPTRPVSAQAPQAHGAISTHVPHAGHDHHLSSRMCRCRYFNPRAPCGARPEGSIRRAHDVVISTHAPRTGRDVHLLLATASQDGISTHAPRTGRDPCCTPGTSALIADFNPRAPHGARHLLRGGCAAGLDFNPRAPYGARQQKCTNNLLHFCNNRQ